MDSTTIAQQKRLSFDEWLKQQFGLKSKFEGISDQDIALWGDPGKQKFSEPTVKYVFNTPDNLESFTKFFNIALKAGYQKDRTPSLYINSKEPIEGGIVSQEDLNSLKKLKYSYTIALYIMEAIKRRILIINSKKLMLSRHIK